jgi:hypothetical protein
MSLECMYNIVPCCSYFSLPLFPVHLHTLGLQIWREIQIKFFLIICSYFQTYLLSLPSYCGMFVFKMNIMHWDTFYEYFEYVSPGLVFSN